MFANFALAILLEMTILLSVRQLDWWHVSQLSTGPWSIIFALFVHYYFDIPKINATSLFGFPVSGKLIDYLIGVHVMTSSPEHCVTALAGIGSGVICRSNLFRVCDWLCLPDSLCRKIGSWVGPWFESKAPTDKFDGATLDIQRQQHMDEMEQNLILESQSDLGSSGSIDASEQEIEDYVNELVEMGFDQQEAAQALRQAGNDIAQAAAFLLEN